MFQSQSKPTRPDHLRFSYLCLDPGKTIKGWVTGPVFSVETHYVEGTKPCYRALTEGELACRFCVAQMRRSFTVYQPFWSDTGEKFVAVLGESMKEICDALKFGEQIVISKGKAKNKPYRLRQEQFTTFDSGYVQRLQFQHDIRPWCLQLWKLPDLVEKYGLEPELISVGKEVESVRKASRIPVLSVKQALKKAREKMESWEETTLPTPSKNGKH